MLAADRKDYTFLHLGQPLAMAIAITFKSNPIFYWCVPSCFQPKSLIAYSNRWLMSWAQR